MAFSYSISYGIAGGFITYCIVKTCKKQAKDVHPVICQNHASLQLLQL